MLLQETHPQKVIILDTNPKFTNCSFCNLVFDECSCKCNYCDQRDSCECVLFDSMTGLWTHLGA